MLTTDFRIDALRQAMRQQKLDAYMVLSADPHLSEYLPEHWQGRQWLSGFTGSVGTLVVTQDFAGLWVDSRYWEQAEAQLRGSCVQCMKIEQATASGHVDWLAQHLPSGAVVGVDGDVLGLAAFRRLTAALTPAEIRLAIRHDLLTDIWPDRPALPQAQVYEHLPPFAQESRTQRLARVREVMRANGADVHLISALDDVAWLLNLRGADVDYNPVFMAHLLLSLDRATLFVAPGKVSTDIVSRLAADGIVVAEYTQVAQALGALKQDQILMIDPARVTCGVFHLMNPALKRVETINPSTFFKARKSDAELEQIREVMAEDGAALAEFFAWFEAALGHERITELTIDEQITAARARRPRYVSPSFATIAGFNANGAMPHYRATETSHAVIEGDGLLLIDSGGQYLGGTTDITRVVAIGAPSNAQKADFTRVLKGMIALSQAVFPCGLSSPLLDVLARAPIWAGGAEYGHGTGHGVGYFLNVHEGPQVISYRSVPGPHTAMEVGMITSNEPGIYRPGRWGVRIENLVANRPGPSGEFGKFLCFETLTLCPIDTRCIERSLMCADEISWLDDYHRLVRERVAPRVQGAALDWLLARTEPLAEPGV